mmetsp:Transcript_14784/g.45863  ORF Transcript_14784/g.45863 Transcript_14784/m.45863 type:complete len:212 (+) Transcript_14784:1911-2546(+)
MSSSSSPDPPPSPPKGPPAVSSAKEVVFRAVVVGLRSPWSLSTASRTTFRIAVAPPTVDVSVCPDFTRGGMLPATVDVGPANCDLRRRLIDAPIASDTPASASRTCCSNIATLWCSRSFSRRTAERRCCTATPLSVSSITDFSKSVARDSASSSCWFRSERVFVMRCSSSSSSCCRACCRSSSRRSSFIVDCALVAACFASAFSFSSTVVW